MIAQLLFSDAAKYALIAKSINLYGKYSTDFSFYLKDLFTTQWIIPTMPYSIAGFFKIFGVTDFAVIATSTFYYLLSIIFTYLLAKQIFKSRWVGALSALAVGASYDLIHYATNGASESPFIFEIVAGLYFASLKKKWANVMTVLFLILLYFTRPQAFIYIAGIILFWLLNNYKLKKALISFAGIILVGVLVDYFVLMPLNGKYFLYSILYRGTVSSFNQSSTASDALRGAAVAGGGIVQTLKNTFYNLYNFYKALPDIINPYFFALFVVGVFLRSKNSLEKAFRISSVFMIILTLFVTAASIPFYRYIHPIIPLVYILAVGTLVRIISKFEILNTKQNSNHKSQITNKRFVILSSLILILLFGVGQTVGIFLLDSRFEAKTHNVGKPPVYVELSKILKENTSPDDVVITNLDTWGSWYGERKTVWFPMEPKQLIDENLPAGRQVPFDAIYLTSYLIDDDNYYMGENWRMIFENPEDSKKWTCDGCAEIAKEFHLKGIYKVNADGNYEKENATGVLWIRND